MRESVIKHTGAVEISGAISGQQRKIWNVLLGFAYSDILFREEHSISLRLLAVMLEYPRSSYERLKEDLQALVETVVAWNILNKSDSNREEWNVCTMFSGVSIVGGTVTYSYHPRLRKLLHNPPKYARINLSHQLRLKSKYALVLYELCESYWREGSTPLIPVEQYRAIMGVGAMEWRDVQKRLIKEPIEQLHHSTPFRLTLQTVKEGSKITHIRFAIQKREQVRFQA
jgi:plasmid replication initiation protein